jgi:hypothetical protein
MTQPSILSIGGVFMKNEYYIDTLDDVVLIYVNYKGKQLSTVIDIEDFKIADSINGTWYVSGGYIIYQPVINGKRINVRLHRLIMNCPENMLVDHINREPLDNRKSNLRIVTEQENLNNKGNYKNNTSGMKGVAFNKSRNRWRAIISVGDGKQRTIGSFKTKEEAEQCMITYNMTQG